jgi:hypothetical protein
MRFSDFEEGIDEFLQDKSTISASLLNKSQMEKNEETLLKTFTLKYITKNDC